MSRPRRIVIDGVPYRYSRRHGHVAGLSGHRLCEEVLHAWREDRSQRALVLRFRDTQGGASLAGGGWGGHDGALLIDDKHVNLNLPKVVAALLQERAAAQLAPLVRNAALDALAAQGATLRGRFTRRYLLEANGEKPAPRAHPGW